MKSLYNFKEAYEILQEYMENYSFSFEENEFKNSFQVLQTIKIGLNGR